MGISEEIKGESTCEFRDFSLLKASKLRREL
jgi:hypothetical protein